MIKWINSWKGVEQCLPLLTWRRFYPRERLTLFCPISSPMFPGEVKVAPGQGGPSKFGVPVASTKESHGGDLGLTTFWINQSSHLICPGRVENAHLDPSALATCCPQLPSILLLSGPWEWPPWAQRCVPIQSPRGDADSLNQLPKLP